MGVSPLYSFILEKLKLQQDWIGDLTEQNEMLVRAVEELEIEATERVKMLEDKLQRSAENINEVIKKYREYDSTNSLLEEPRKKIFHLENDLKNLLEFLRRIREEQQWDSGGLVFYDLTENDLFGSKNNEESRSVKQFLNVDTVKGRRKLEEQENIIREIEKKIIEGVCLGKQLEIKKEECENLQKNMIDMRQALTEEVATKHDMILKLKKEVQELEERCIQADKQTAFRDDIIKELRKEIKQLKQQGSELELVKYKIDVSLHHIETTITIEEKSNEMNTSKNFEECIQHLSNLAGPSIRDNLYSFMEKELLELNKMIDIKHNQLLEMFQLTKILIQKIFNADIGLKFLEERAESACKINLDQVFQKLKEKC